MLKIVVLTDNNTITDRYYLGEPALSLYVEVDGLKILFDTGYSDVFIKNAQKADIDLASVDFIVLSHGHNDHTGGLRFYIDYFKNKKHFPKIIASPDVFKQRYDEEGEFGCPVEKEEVEKTFQVIYSKQPFVLSNDVVFLGEIPRCTNFEANASTGFLKDTNEPDFVTDDSALVIKQGDGIVILTGCSHCGIVNICEYAKKICNAEKISSIIGGLHLKDSDFNQIEKTVDYLQSLNLKELYACHCTGFEAQCRLKTRVNLRETGSGLCICFN